MLKILKSLLTAAVIFMAGWPLNLAFAEDIFYYRGPKLQPAKAGAVLFLTPIKERKNNLAFLDVIVEPNGEEINAVGAEILYPKNKIIFQGLSKKNSFCSFFVEENFQPEEGLIKISCVAPYPGTDKISNVVTLAFSPLSAGEAALGLGDDSQVLANDGYGTDILTEKKGQTIFN
jgi:hypothetical protein